MKTITVGEKIKQLRRKNNIQQSRLAKYLNVTNGAISNWENNRRLPSIEELKKIAECFKVSLDYFSDGSYNFETREVMIEEKQEEAMKVLTYDHQKWSFSMISRLLLIVSSFALLLSAFVEERAAILFFFYGFYTMVSYVVFVFIQYDRQKHKMHSIEVEVSYKLVYRHQLNQDMLNHKKKNLLILSFISVMMNALFIGLYLFLLYRLDYFAMFMILIIYFIAFSLGYYYQFGVLYHKAMFDRVKAYDESKKSFKSYVFKIMLLLHMMNMILVSTIFIASEFNPTTLLVAKICMLIVFVCFIVYLVFYVIYGSFIEDYDLCVTRDEVHFQSLG
jgi:transcriptional regulator with XRE-family HTH domain